MEQPDKTYIRIKNFKSLEDVEIELRPLTFLFGPNSSGKSSLFKALKFLKANLFPLSPNEIQFKLDKSTDIVSYKNLITNGEVNRKLIFEIEMTSDIWEEGVDYQYEANESIIEYNRPAVNRGAISSIHSAGTVSSWEENQAFTILDSPNNRKFKIIPNSESLYDYESLDRETFEGTEEEYEIADGGFSLGHDGGEISFFPFKFRIEFSFIESSVNMDLIYIENLIDNSFYEYYPTLKNSEKHNNTFNIFTRPELNEELQRFFNSLDHSPFVDNDLERFYGYLKRYFYREIQKSDLWKELDYDEKRFYFYQVIAWYHIIFQFVPDQTKKLLNFFHLPTIRELPRKYYELKDNEFIADDYYGIPFLISSQDREFKRFLNKYLKLFELSSNIKVKKETQVGLIEFTHFDSRLRSNLIEGSSGLLQLLPIIIKSYMNILNDSEFGSNLMIEQPELHLHPRLQSLLAQFFVDIINDSLSFNPLILIETHSEHLMRKIQVVLAKKQIDNNDVAVYYFDNSKRTTQIIAMEMEENGFFKNPWPNGFFDDSYNLARELIYVRNN
ncbi:MAG: DUF3696 domain-containing protein [Ignavibacteria bacterium]|jgi:predicted ATPase